MKKEEVLLFCVIGSACIYIPHSWHQQWTPILNKLSNSCCCCWSCWSCCCCWRPQTTSSSSALSPPPTKHQQHPFQLAVLISSTNLRSTLHRISIERYSSALMSYKKLRTWPPLNVNIWLAQITFPVFNKIASCQCNFHVIKEIYGTTWWRYLCLLLRYQTVGLLMKISDLFEDFDDPQEDAEAKEDSSSKSLPPVWHHRAIFCGQPQLHQHVIVDCESHTFTHLS